MSDPLPTFGPYTARERLGSGGAGEVWLADSPTGPVALKVATHPMHRRSLRHEAAVTGTLDHRYVVQLVDADSEGAWLALEYVKGPDLGRWAWGRPLPALVEVLARLAEGLAHVHASGVVHGDLKPSNILVDEYGNPRLIDLGVARLKGHGPREGFHATLGYAAPEVLAGAAPGPHSDVWSLGAVIFSTITGQPPFSSGDAAALAWLPGVSLPEPPSAQRSRIPQKLDELVLDLLARNPRSRPQTAHLAELLRAAARSPVADPVVGMGTEREALRRAVVACAEGTGAVFVLQGAEGSGRSTLIAEATASARREGLEVVEASPPELALVRLRGLRAPALVPCMEAGKQAVELALRVLQERLPALVLVRAERAPTPLITQGARVLPMSPFTEQDVARLLEAEGRERKNAADLLSRTRGAPGAVAALVRPSRTSGPRLSSAHRELLEALAPGPQRIDLLAALLGIGEHGVVDLAEPLIDQGLVAEREEGATLALLGGAEA